MNNYLYFLIVLMCLFIICSMMVFFSLFFFLLINLHINNNDSQEAYDNYVVYMTFQFPRMCRLVMSIYIPFYEMWGYSISPLYLVMIMMRFYSQSAYIFLSVPKSSYNNEYYFFVNTILRLFSLFLFIFIFMF